MCGVGMNSVRMQAAGVLNSLKEFGWLEVASELADLSDDDFSKLMEAFRTYRREILREKNKPGNLILPRKKQLKRKGKPHE